MGHYFGTDGIRGEVGKTLTLKMAYAIGQSLKTVFNPQTIISVKTQENQAIYSRNISQVARWQKASMSSMRVLFQHQ